jgi:hypothetical protein
MATSLSLSFYVLWLLAFLGFPIGGAVAYSLVGAVDSPVRAALAGLITGLVIGVAQWLVLRQALPLNPGWNAVTGIGMAVGLAAGVALFGTENAGNPLLLRAALTGLLIGVAQWLLLREHVAMNGWWLLVIAGAWAIAWAVTRAFGVDLTRQWSVFGSSGAIVFQLLTAVVLRLLLVR